MLEFLKGNLTMDDPHIWNVMLLSALLHDIGKIKTTYYDDKEKDWCCKDHGKVGERMVREIFCDEKDLNLLEEVCYLVRWHMTPHYLLFKKINKRMEEVERLKHGLVDPAWLLILNQCDRLASINNETEHTRKAMTMLTELFCPKFVGGEGIREVDVLIGIPGCGKTTHREKLLQSLEGKDHAAVCLCRDEIRTEIGLKGEKPMGNRDEENKVTKIFDERFAKALEDGKDIIIDNTNLKAKYRKQIYDKAKEYDYLVNFFFVETPLETCIERRKGQISEDVIRRMWTDFEFPQAWECDALHFVGINND